MGHMRNWKGVRKRLYKYNLHIVISPKKIKRKNKECSTKIRYLLTSSHLEFSCFEAEVKITP